MKNASRKPDENEINHLHSLQKRLCEISSSFQELPIESLQKVSCYQHNGIEQNIPLEPSKQTSFKKLHRQLEISNVIQQYEKAERVNVLFLLDATNSMKKYLDTVKMQIKDIAKRLEADHSHMSLYLGVVAYRDYEVPTRFESLPFTACIETFEGFIEGIVAMQSNDTTEDVLGE